MKKKTTIVVVVRYHCCRCRNRNRARMNIKRSGSDSFVNVSEADRVKESLLFRLK